MYEQSVTAQPGQLPDENKVAGTVGAFLFALVGGLAFYLLYQVGKLAAISGIIGVSCALVGYRLFAKRESRYGMVIAIVMAALAIVLAWYLCLSKDVYKAYQEWYQSGEIDYTVDFFTAVRHAWRFLSEPDIARGYLTDLVLGLLLCLLGGSSSFYSSMKRAKAQQAAAAQAAMQSAQPPYAQPVYTPSTASPQSAPAQAVYVPPTAPAAEPTVAPTVLNGEEAD